jgi:crotonobetainyl-CoA hydratase
MILTARHVSPEEGKELGFVHEVVPHDELMERALKLAKQITELSPLSIRASKEVVYKSLDAPSLQASMEAQYDAVRAMAKREDFIEGPKAFSEKRPPNWKGK